MTNKPLRLPLTDWENELLNWATDENVEIKIINAGKLESGSGSEFVMGVFKDGWYSIFTLHSSISRTFVNEFLCPSIAAVQKKFEELGKEKVNEAT